MKLLYVEVLLVSKILAGLKTVLKTLEVSSFDPFFSLLNRKSPRVTAKVCSFVDMSTKLTLLEVLTALK